MTQCTKLTYGGCCPADTICAPNGCVKIISASIVGIETATYSSIIKVLDGTETTRTGVVSVTVTERPAATTTSVKTGEVPQVKISDGHSIFFGLCLPYSLAALLVIMALIMGFLWQIRSQSMCQRLSPVSFAIKDETTLYLGIDWFWYIPAKLSMCCDLSPRSQIPWLLTVYILWVFLLFVYLCGDCYNSVPLVLERAYFFAIPARRAMELLSNAQAGRSWCYLLVQISVIYRTQDLKTL